MRKQWGGYHHGNDAESGRGGAVNATWNFGDSRGRDGASVNNAEVVGGKVNQQETIKASHKNNNRPWRRERVYPR